MYIKMCIRTSFSKTFNKASVKPSQALLCSQVLENFKFILQARFLQAVTQGHNSFFVFFFILKKKIFVTQKNSNPRNTDCKRASAKYTRWMHNGIEQQQRSKWIHSCWSEKFHSSFWYIDYLQKKLVYVLFFPCMWCIVWCASSLVNRIRQSKEILCKWLIFLQAQFTSFYLTSLRHCAHWIWEKSWL